MNNGTRAPAGASLPLVTPGRLIAEARSHAGLTLRAVSGAIGVSIPYLHDVEHDRRKLSPARWYELKDVLPSLSLYRLAAAAIEAGPVTIDARPLGGEARATFAAALLDAAARGAR